MPDTRWTLDPKINSFLDTMELPPAPFWEELMAEREPLELAAPQEGDPAPDFSAERLSAEGRQSGKSISLSDFRGRKLALLFGSYTCPVYRGQIERFTDIYEELKDRMAFLLIYIIEAHPEDGWQLDINHSQDVVYDQPSQSTSRAAIAADCMLRHQIKMPVALDSMDNAISDLYAASPERLYLIDSNGIVRHRSVMGPFKMKAINAWHEALRG